MAYSINNFPQFEARPQQQMAAPLADTLRAAPQSNPFDQFDGPQQAPQEVQGNPFDQFDGDTAAQADGAMGSFVKGAMNGATLNFADPILAGAQALVGNPFNAASQAGTLGERYHENLKWQRERGEANRQAHPVASLAGEVAGGFALPVGKINSAKAAMKMGAMLGAGYGVGAGVTRDQGVGDTLEQGVMGGAFGGAAGGVLGAASNKISTKLLPKFKAWNSQRLAEKSRAQYKVVEDSGHVISEDALNAMADSAVDKFASKLPDEFASQYPYATGALKYLSRYGTDGDLAAGGASFAKLDEVRKSLGHAMESTTPADKMFARQIFDHFDNFIGRIDEVHLDRTALDDARNVVTSLTGKKGSVARNIADIERNKSGALAARGAAGKGTRDRYMKLRQELVDLEDERTGALKLFQQEGEQLKGGGEVVKALRGAQDYWKRSRKTETIEKLIKKAHDNSTMFSQSGLENSLRAQFRKLMNSERGMSKFTKEERDAIRKVAMGGKRRYSATNLLRDVGKLAPVGAIPLLLHTGAAASSGGMSLGVAGLGLAGRTLATKRQMAAAEAARDLMSVGPKNASMLNSTPLLSAGSKRLKAIRAARYLPKLTPATVAAGSSVSAN
jgi:hypothetical protein